MKKKIVITSALAMVLVLLTTVVSASQAGYQVFIKEQLVSANMIAVEESNVMLLPAAPLFQAYHYKVKPQANSKIVIATDGYTKLEFELGNKTAYIKGMNQYTGQAYEEDLKVTLPVAPAIINDRIYLPIAYIAKSLGLYYEISKTGKKIVFYPVPGKAE